MYTSAPPVGLCGMLQGEMYLNVTRFGETGSEGGAGGGAGVGAGGGVGDGAGGGAANCMPCACSRTA
jgi:hypothetical protein